MTQIIPFQFDAETVRVHVDEYGAPWWEAQDVCKILNIRDVSKAVARLHLGEKRTSESRNVLIINESGLYRLIFRSNKPEASAFQDWVFGEVLPTIRKTGKYEVQPVAQNGLVPLDVLRNALDYLIAHETRLTDHDARLARLEATQGNGTGYMSLLAYCRLHGWHKSLSELQVLGQTLTKRAKELGLTLGKVPDERYGRINSYPIELLNETFSQN